LDKINIDKPILIGPDGEMSLLGRETILES
jgi:hypothetical protein